MGGGVTAGPIDLERQDLSMWRVATLLRPGVTSSHSKASDDADESWADSRPMNDLSPTHTHTHAHTHVHAYTHTLAGHTCSTHTLRTRTRTYTRTCICAHEAFAAGFD